MEKLNSFWIKSCISQRNCILPLESLNQNPISYLSVFILHITVVF